MGWRSKKNGELLRLMETFGFEALLTGDKQMQFQQNWRSYALPVLVLDAHGDQYEDYLALMPQIKALLAQPDLPVARLPAACGPLADDPPARGNRPISIPSSGAEWVMVEPGRPR